MANLMKKDGKEGQQGQRGGGERELVRFDPFQMMRELMTDPFSLFQMTPWRGLGLGRGELAWNPSFEIRETDDAFLFKGDLPGLKQEDVDVTLTGNRLQVSGKRDEEKEISEGTVHAYERSFGSFSRSFTLPETADLDKIRCDLKDGVLTMVVPKKAGAGQAAKKIQIGGGSKA